MDYIVHLGPNVSYAKSLMVPFKYRIISYCIVSNLFIPNNYTCDSNTISIGLKAFRMGTEFGPRGTILWRLMTEHVDLQEANTTRKEETRSRKTGGETRTRGKPPARGMGFVDEAQRLHSHDKCACEQK